MTFVALALISCNREGPTPDNPTPDNPTNSNCVNIKHKCQLFRHILWKSTLEKVVKSVRNTQKGKIVSNTLPKKSPVSAKKGT